MATSYEIINVLKKHSKGIVIYDIDGTLIDNFGNPKHSIIDTYKYALAKGLKTVIITARPGFIENIHWTEMQLSNFGITGYSEIYFMPVGKFDQATYKLLARKNVNSKGNVIASIGDMPWDYGKYGGIGFQV